MKNLTIKEYGSPFILSLSEKIQNLVQKESDFWWATKPLERELKDYAIESRRAFIKNFIRDRKLKSL